MVIISKGDLVSLIERDKLKYISRISGDAIDHDMAQDLYQTSITQAYRYSQPINLGDERRFFQTILNRRVTDYLRKNGENNQNGPKKRVQFGLVAADEVVDEPTNSRFPVEFEEVYQFARRDLSSNQLHAIEQHYLKGQSASEIAESLGIKTNAVESRIFQGMEKLRKKYLPKAA